MRICCYSRGSSFNTTSVKFYSWITRSFSLSVFSLYSKNDLSSHFCYSLWLKVLVIDGDLLLIAFCSLAFAVVFSNGDRMSWSASSSMTTSVARIYIIWGREAFLFRSSQNSALLLDNCRYTPVFSKKQEVFGASASPQLAEFKRRLVILSRNCCSCKLAPSLLILLTCSNC